jgi:hypothetical protein
LFKTRLCYQYKAYTWTVPGTPIPAPRLTNARKYDVRLRRDIPSPELARELVQDARAQRITRGYYAFKEAVRAALLDAYPNEPLFPQCVVGYGWPFKLRSDEPGAQAVVEYALAMPTAKTGRCTHGDPDNIAKAILDALFGDDRHVLPRCVGLTCGAQQPHVAITVQLLD